MTLRMHPPREPVRTPAERPQRATIGTLVVWLLGVLAAGFVVWVVYVITAINGGGCGEFGLFRSGGAASDGSLSTAAVVGTSLWIAAAVAAFWLRRELDFSSRVSSCSTWLGWWCCGTCRRCSGVRGTAEHGMA
jgi:hypothetical protein